MATEERTRPRTWSMLGDVKRRPSVYEATTARFNYHFRRQPAPFELDPASPLNIWYLTYREGSAFNVPDWEGFRDPAKLTYSDYVALQHERETYLDLLVDHHEAAGTTASLSPAWVQVVRSSLVPSRFPLHVLQMLALYVGQMAPAAYISNCANFQAADEMRRIQRIAYVTKLLSLSHGDELASTDLARDAWQNAPQWQPWRQVSERLLATYDWGEAFVVLNLLLKPAMDALCEQLAVLATVNGDEFLALMLAEFQRDSTRSQAWTSALVQYAFDADPATGAAVRGWLDTWVPPVDAAVEAVAQTLGASAVADACVGVGQTRERLWASSGL